MIGIFINDLHSWQDFHLGLLERSLSALEKDDHTERVPYSNIVYDYDDITGIKSYAPRTLTYKFDYLDSDLFRRQDTFAKISEWLTFSGQTKLYDSFFVDYYFMVREPKIQIEDAGYPNVFYVTLTFQADPQIYTRDGAPVWLSDIWK